MRAGDASATSLNMSANSEPVPPLPPRSKVRRRLFQLIILGLALYLVLPQFAKIQQALQIVSSLSIKFVMLALCAQVLSYLGGGYLLGTVVGRGGTPVSVVDGALLTVGANSVGTLGGGVLGTAGLTYLWLRRRGVSPGTAGLGGWLPIFLNNAMLASVSLIGLITLISFRKFSGLLVLALAFAVLILAGGFGTLLWCVTHRAKVTILATKMTRLAAKIRRKPVDPDAIEAAIARALEAWDALSDGGWTGPATGAALNTGFDMLTLELVFLAAGHSVNPLVLIAGYGVPQLLGKLTVVLGGVGVVETAMLGLFGVLAVATPVAVVVVIVYRLFSFWMPTLAGVALVPYLEHREDRAQ
jgi:glycosyltransferase 2 family protein